jgi:hypothetical protein
VRAYQFGSTAQAVPIRRAAARYVGTRTWADASATKIGYRRYVYRVVFIEQYKALSYELPVVAALQGQHLRAILGLSKQLSSIFAPAKG